MIRAAAFLIQSYGRHLKPAFFAFGNIAKKTFCELKNLSKIPLEYIYIYIIRVWDYFPENNRKDIDL